MDSPLVVILPRRKPAGARALPELVQGREEVPPDRSLVCDSRLGRDSLGQRSNVEG